jgi:peptide/nickel transport system substrate-binding protein
MRVREAIALAFDFDWINANLFHDAYVRTRSYWDNSDLGARGPADARERALLAPFPDAVTPDILENGWTPPQGGDRTALRDNLRQAVGLLADAGYGVENGAMVNLETGEPLSFEIMLKDRTEERLALNLRDTLQNIGIAVNVRLVDAAQFTARAQTYDFDMMPFRYTGSLSPGNEQAFRFGSREADIEGTFNYAGVHSQAVDYFIDAITDARTREDLQAATRALDRTLLSGYYVIPLYHQTVDRIAYWGEIDHPEDTPLTGYLQGTRFKHETWWYTPDN